MSADADELSEGKATDGGVITVRVPRGLMEQMEAKTAGRFSTKSEYIRDLIRKDVLDPRPVEVAKGEGAAA